ncbi:hypothetical protein [Chengkuizengella marina]|uniref:Uncharacterized protein n=1 Tax=Chengkuizengella marina TaxID=2507566 RepID=A0A6N9Q1M1_9BACL|nr:hypothetical protein [Chengkuizengella marina]NBI27994.1 hypothetical protein [Chengkuizengella marina]
MSFLKNEKGAVIIYVLIISAFLMLITPILFDMMISTITMEDKNEDLKLVTLSTVSGMETFLKYVEDVKDDLVSIEDLYEFDESSGREDLRYPGYTDHNGIEIILPNGLKAKYIMDIDKKPDPDDSSETYYEVTVSTSIGSGTAKQEKTITYILNDGSNGGDPGDGEGEPNIPEDVNDEVEENVNIGLRYILGENSSAKFLKQTGFWFDVEDENYRFVEYHYITDDHDNRTVEFPINTNNSVYCYINTSTECNDVDVDHTITTNTGNLAIIQYKIVTQTIEQFHDGKQLESFWITPFGVSFNSSSEFYVWFTPDEFTTTGDPDYESVNFKYSIPGNNNNQIILDYNKDIGKYEATITTNESIKRLDYQFKFKKNSIDKTYTTESIEVPVHGVELSQDKKEAMIWYIPDDRIKKYKKVQAESILPRQTFQMEYKEDNDRFEAIYSLPPISEDGVTVKQPISLIQYYILLDKNKNNRNNENKIERSYWNTFWDPDILKGETIYFERKN